MLQKITLARIFALSAIPRFSGLACAVIRPLGIVSKGMGTEIVNTFGTLIDVRRQRISWLGELQVIICFSF